MLCGRLPYILSISFQKVSRRRYKRSSTGNIDHLFIYISLFLCRCMFISITFDFIHYAVIFTFLCSQPKLHDFQILIYCNSYRKQLTFYIDLVFPFISDNILLSSFCMLFLLKRTVRVFGKPFRVEIFCTCVCTDGAISVHLYNCAEYVKQFLSFVAVAVEV